METDRLKWNSRYSGDGFFLGPTPSRFLTEQIGLIEAIIAGNEALDIACGEGRNSIFLARRGFKVTGIDISGGGIAKASRWAAEEGLEIAFVEADLERYQFIRSYDLIINFNFLLRELIPVMVSCLNPGGIVLFDTILDSPALPGIHNQAFLLGPGELETLFSRFPGRILHYSEHRSDDNPTAKLVYQNNFSHIGGLS